MAEFAAPPPPRVIPLFINELASSTTEMRELHVRHFTKNVDDIFRARVVDEDIADLVVALCSLCRCPRSYEPSRQGGAFVAHSALQLLLELFNVRKDRSAQCFRVVKRLFERIARKMQAETEKKGLKALEHLSRTADGVDTSLTSRSVTTHSTNDADHALDVVSPIRAANGNSGIFASGENDEFVRSAEAPRAIQALHVEQLLENECTRLAAVILFQLLDRSGIDVSLLTSDPSKLHLHLPHRFTASAKVYRDFVFCTPRPKLTKQWGPVATVHIKTNIRSKSEVMYRIVVEGYNYGVNAPIFSDVVGYTNRNWDELGKMTKYGWPEGWDDTATNDYAPGAAISQYFSNDEFVVVRLQAKSFFSVGFSVSAWLCFHGMGNGFAISATIHHQDADL